MKHHPQPTAFLKGEGKAWLDRNIDKLNKMTEKDDPVIQAMIGCKLKPKSVLEVGCANGWRLNILRTIMGCEIYGLEPGLTTSFDGYIFQGVANEIPFFARTFDLIIYGWCLYLCDPEDYFKIAAEGDRVLQDGGHLIIHDFNDYPIFKTKYKHKEGLWSYHYDFSKLWLSHPAYHVVGRTMQKDTSVTILKKNLDCFPVK